jgi:pentatricopeptide repeat protein
VNAFAREGLCEKAEEVFEQLQEAGPEPDVYAYNASWTLTGISITLDVPQICDCSIILV